jgi:hypothetical protein
LTTNQSRHPESNDPPEARPPSGRIGPTGKLAPRRSSGAAAIPAPPKIELVIAWSRRQHSPWEQDVELARAEMWAACSSNRALSDSIVAGSLRLSAAWSRLAHQIEGARAAIALGGLP